MAGKNAMESIVLLCSVQHDFSQFCYFFGVVPRTSSFAVCCVPVVWQRRDAAQSSKERVIPVVSGEFESRIRCLCQDFLPDAQPFGVKLYSTRLNLELDGGGLERGGGAFQRLSSSKASRVPVARVGAKGRVWGCEGILDGDLDLGEERKWDFRKLAVTIMTAARPFRRKASRTADSTACQEKKPSTRPRDGASLTSPPPRPCFDMA